jgi:YbbR domain-containing protein
MSVWTRVRAILVENLGLKIASLLLAILLYGHVVTDQERESSVAIPIRLTGLADTLATSGDVPARITVKVRGKWRDLIRLTLAHPGLPVDMAEVGSGQFRNTISAEDVQHRAIPAEFAKAITVTEVLDPRSIDVRVEPRVSRMVRVAPRVLGEPSPGYRLDGVPRATPDSVRVSGPASLVGGLDSLLTLPVDIAGERARIQRQVDVVLEPGGISLEPRRCLVTVRLVRADREAGDAGP